MASGLRDDERLVLVGDIGGTNSRLQIHRVSTVEVDECDFDSKGTDCARAAVAGEVVSERRYENAAFESFDDVLTRFFIDENLASPDASLPLGLRWHEGGPAPSVACLAVAGVVEENVPGSFLRRFDAAPVVLRLLRKGCRLDDASLARLLDDDARLWRA